MPFIKNNDPLWTELLRKTPHDIYHLPGYCTIEAQLLDGEALAWCFHDEDNTALIPLISRNIKGTRNYKDLVSPYGYPGVITAKPATTQEAAKMLHAFNTEAAENHFVSSFIRLNPILNNWNFNSEYPWRQWFHGSTVSINLTNKLDEIRKRFSLNHCRNLRKLDLAGYHATISEWSSINEFIDSYTQTMSRRKAHPYYFFPDTYFEALKTLLNEKIIYVAVHNSQNNFVAGGLFTHFGEVMQFHLGATSDIAVRQSPSKMMMDQAIQYGMQAGAKMLHLGGGLGASITDGLFRFKKGFGDMLHQYSSLRFIHNSTQYTNLRKKYITHDLSTAYFPEYRLNTAVNESHDK